AVQWLLTRIVAKMLECQIPRDREQIRPQRALALIEPSRRPDKCQKALLRNVLRQIGPPGQPAHESKHCTMMRFERLFRSHVALTLSITASSPKRYFNRLFLDVGSESASAPGEDVKHAGSQRTQSRNSYRQRIRRSRNGQTVRGAHECR